MSRNGSLELLTEVEETLHVMHVTQNIKSVKVKAMLEHLRSSLEYLANDIYDTYHPSSTRARPKVYFPFGKEIFVDNFFRKTLNISPPSSSPMYDVLSSIQCYRTGEVWLEIMCNLTNEVKHRKPISLEEKELVTGATINIMGSNLFHTDTTSTIIVEGLEVGGQKISDFKYEKGNFSKKNNGLPVNLILTKEKKIKFHGHDYDVVPFITECLTKLRIFINKSYDILESI